MVQLCDRKICTGCSACASACPGGAITMRADSEGFLFPSVDAGLCSGCGLCEKACPQIATVNRHDVPAVYAAWNTSDDVRCASSSGGLFYTFARKVIEEGGAVFGAVLSDDMHSVSHRYATDMDGVKPMMGSKYVQSDIGVSYRQVKEFLKACRKVLFTGTPCQVAGLYGFLGRCETSNLYTVDVICHGVPSASLLKFYLDVPSVQAAIQRTGRMVFRDPSAWPGSFTGPMQEYVSLFLSGQFMRESCYSCSHTTIRRVSDITIGDFWGIGECIPFDGDTSKGCSVALVNSEKGGRLLESVKGSLFLQERTAEEALAHNAQLHSPTRRHARRDSSYSYIQHHSLFQAMLRFVDYSYGRKIKRILKQAFRKS